MYRLIVVLFLGACAGNLPMSLEQRFAEVAFHDDGGPGSASLWRWDRPIRPEISGPAEYRQRAIDHLQLLGELTGLPVELDSVRPNLTIEFSDRRKDVWCNYALNGRPTLYRAEIYIATDQPERHIKRCITQELSQVFGLIDDTDGRTDTTFSSAIGTDFLTPADLALFEILYDRRLRAGMSRAEVLAVLPKIVADVEAAQEAGRQE